MYTISPNHAIMSPFQPVLLFDKDAWETFSEADADEHFSNITNLLLDRVAILGTNEQVLTQRDEKELQLLLDAFVQAKSFIQDRSQ